MSQLENQLTDEEIARLVQSGEIESFDILIERYEAKMKRYAKRFLFDYEEAEDLAQEVFLKVYINIQSFKTSKKFSSWIYRIAHNEFINAIKKKGKEPISFFDSDVLFPHPVSKENTDKQITESELRAMLDKCINKLKPKYREPIVLYYFEELSYKEIADILCIPISTVGIRLRRGKKIMQSLLH
ncbi:MAG: RNA polymerase sigma factor [Candidatus Pacebacteria bacterium]|nr:RNA polymerase sigma factor [Candidatus Paceibacterota bacterium]